MENSKKLSLKAISTMFMALALVISLVFTFVSGAFFRNNKTASGTLAFGNGILANITNLSAENAAINNNSIQLKLHVSSYNETDYSVEEPPYQELTAENFDSISPEDVLTIANPTITAVSGTKDYYLRAKWVVKTETDEGVYSEPIATNLLSTSANIASLPHFDPTQWALGADGYYYNTTNASFSGAADLSVNTYNEELSTGTSVTFFDIENSQVIIVGNENFNNEILGLSIELLIEVLEANVAYANTTWSTPQADVGLVLQSMLANSNTLFRNKSIAYSTNVGAEQDANMDNAVFYVATDNAVDYLQIIGFGDDDTFTTPVAGVETTTIPTLQNLASFTFNSTVSGESTHLGIAEYFSFIANIDSSNAGYTLSRSGNLITVQETGFSENTENAKKYEVTILETNSTKYISAIAVTVISGGAPSEADQVLNSTTDAQSYVSLPLGA